MVKQQAFVFRTARVHSLLERRVKNFITVSRELGVGGVGWKEEGSN